MARKAISPAVTTAADKDNQASMAVDEADAVVPAVSRVADVGIPEIVEAATAAAMEIAASLSDAADADSDRRLRAETFLTN
jgi:hypothetical protein